MNADMIRESAYKLYNAISIEECVDIAETYCNEEQLSNYENLSEYYDTAITIFVMAINRALGLSHKITADNANFYIQVDNHSKEVFEKFSFLVDSINNSNTEICDFENYFRYLQKLLKYIVNDSFNVHSAYDDENYDQWEREWDIREYMKNFIQPNKWTNLYEFTNQYQIQLPYIYMLVHDFGFLWGKRDLDDKSERQAKITNSYLFEDTVFDRIRQSVRNIRNDFVFNLINVKEYSTFPISFEFDVWDEEEHYRRRRDFYECNLLPNLRYKSSINYYNYYVWNENKKIVNPEFYNSIPLVPLELTHIPTPKETASYLLEVFRQDTELEIINKKMSNLNYLLNKVRDSLRCENQDKNVEDLDDEIIEKLNECINKNISGSNDLNKIYNNLADMFGSTWNRFEENTKTSLVSAEYLWRCCQRLSEDDDFDYSGICISATCALENELKKIFFYKYKEYCEERHEFPSYLEDARPFTLGSLKVFFDKSKHGKNHRLLTDYLNHLSSQNHNILNEFTNNRYYNNKSFIELCDEIKIKYRNPSAHPHKINYSTAYECYSIIVNKDEAQQDLNNIHNILIILYDILK